MAQKLLSYARSTATQGICIRAVPLGDAILLSYGDSSWANAAGHKSQAGYVCFLGQPNCLSVVGGAVSPLDWRSHRLRRVCRSTVGAEAMAMDAALDAAQYIQVMLKEALAPDWRASSKVPAPTGLDVHIIPDCRSPHDHNPKLSPGSTLSEKRIAVDFAALKGGATPGQVPLGPNASREARRFSQD